MKPTCTIIFCKCGNKTNFILLESKNSSTQHEKTTFRVSSVCHKMTAVHTKFT